MQTWHENNEVIEGLMEISTKNKREQTCWEGWCRLSGKDSQAVVASVSSQIHEDVDTILIFKLNGIGFLELQAL